MYIYNFILHRTRPNIQISKAHIKMLQYTIYNNLSRPNLDIHQQMYKKLQQTTHSINGRLESTKVLHSTPCNGRAFSKPLFIAILVKSLWLWPTGLNYFLSQKCITGLTRLTWSIWFLLCPLPFSRLMNHWPSLLFDSARSSLAAFHEIEFVDFNSKPSAEEQVALTTASADRLILPTNLPNT